MNEVTVFICPCGRVEGRLGAFNPSYGPRGTRCALADQRDPENSLGYHTPLKFTVPLPERVTADLARISHNSTGDADGV